MMNSVISVLYFNGRVYEENDGVILEGTKKAIHIKCGISFNALKKKIGDKVKLQNNEIISAISCRFLVSRKYVALQICDGEDVETMLESFQQQNQMSVLELYIEKDVVGGSMFHSANSLTSCGNNLSNNEAQPPTNVSNLHGDDDDDDYLVSNSYVEESLDEDDGVDDISDTDDEVADMIQPVYKELKIHFGMIFCIITISTGATLLASIFFYQNLEKFHQLSPAIATWIERILKEKWTMAYDREERRYGHMTTNLSECINKELKDCRNIPITALVKSTYSRCRKYFVDRGRQAQRHLNEGQLYCSKLVKELRKNHEEACSHIVRVYDIHSTRFAVKETFNPITQPCGYVSMNYYQNIDVVYTNEHILKAYFAQWWPFGNEAAIPSSNDAWTLIPGPTTIRAKGRPKSTRIRNEMDWVESSNHRQKCSRCGA
ncbi:hypothetical protein HKD37_19G052851 [Glycine soja]